MNRRLELRSLIPIVVVVVVAMAGFVWWLAGDSGDSGDRTSRGGRDPVDLVADEPEFSRVEEMAAASDVVVHALVVEVQPGRTLTDPQRPDAGIVTELVQLDVVDSAAPGAPSDLIVEQEATLLDGTPVTVNGAEPLRLGDEGVAFLVAGGDVDQPFAALVSSHGWVPVVDGDLEPRPGSVVASGEWGGKSVVELLAAVAGGS